MNVEVSKFQVDDLNYLDVQERHRVYVEKALEMSGPAQRCMVSEWSFTGWSQNGQALWCIGLYDNELWGFLAKDLKRHMVSLVRWGRRELERRWLSSGVPIRVDCTFPEAVRLARALGCRPLGGKHWIYDEKCASSMPPSP